MKQRGSSGSNSVYEVGGRDGSSGQLMQSSTKVVEFSRSKKVLAERHGGHRPVAHRRPGHVALLPQHEKWDRCDREGDVRRARETRIKRPPAHPCRPTVTPDTQDGYTLMCPLLLSKQHGCLVVAHFFFALTNSRS